MPVYSERNYRNIAATPGLVSFSVTVKESDLFVSADRELADEVRRSLLYHRGLIENYGILNPDFYSSLVPLADVPTAPGIVREMLKASIVAGVGPMAAVAGAVAEYVARDLRVFSEHAIVENGGDIYLELGERAATVSIFAGSSPLSYKISLLIEANKTPLSLCTSSATVGPSLSFGTADAVCVVAQSATLADAAATSLCNRVKNKTDIKRVIDDAQNMAGIRGVVVIVGDVMGAWGDLTFV